MEISLKLRGRKTRKGTDKGKYHEVLDYSRDVLLLSHPWISCKGITWSAKKVHVSRFQPKQWQHLPPRTAGVLMIQ